MSASALLLHRDRGEKQDAKAGTDLDVGWTGALQECCGRGDGHAGSAGEGEAAGDQHNRDREQQYRANQAGLL
ncbi:hypothetical protein LMG667_19780 [Xanthomonas euvesicatoria]|uniref:hypothetical protein n=1 Tax=Xanthomonas euvesicatoria TaxID=456327 RepID=UPI00080E1DDE|nr:hypothetical protein [Xanthomonas euvesicatoria]OCG82136.1 hypothetical protein LMG667_19780 [Xanthomonas euvesicatoria]